MIPVSWRNVKSWNCIDCGACCRDYQVVLDFNEWVKIVRNYGVEATKAGVSKLYLRKKSDGTCIFLTKLGDTFLCGLQHMKPKACKIWPVKIFFRPKFGMPRDALYRYRDRNFFVYLDPACLGLSWVKPSREFKYRILSEFIEIVAGLHEKQFHSTSKIRYRPRYFDIIGRKLV
jgi:Fe-S-cluster containining protein